MRSDLGGRERLSVSCLNRPITELHVLHSLLQIPPTPSAGTVNAEPQRKRRHVPFMNTGAAMHLLMRTMTGIRHDKGRDGAAPAISPPLPRRPTSALLRGPVLPG